MKPWFTCAAFLLGSAAVASSLGACGGGGGGGNARAPGDASADSTTEAGTPESGSVDSAGDAPVDSGPSTDSGVTQAASLKIVSTDGGALRAAPGDTIPLMVVFTLADGGTTAVPAQQVTFTMPATIIAQNPNQPGPSILPDAGATPTAFFVDNEYRQSHVGTLFVVDPGTSSDAGVTVTASVVDAGQVSAVIAIATTTIVGNAARGQTLFQDVLNCARCHGSTAAGSPPTDMGDAGVMYQIPQDGGDFFSYPAPGLNNSSPGGTPNVAADPAWNAALLGMAVQADMDNAGVSLRTPMPDFFQATSDDAGATLNAQDFADIYAWLKTQTH